MAYFYCLAFRFYTRWKDWESWYSQSFGLHFSLREEQWQEDWAFILSLASQVRLLGAAAPVSRVSRVADPSVYITRVTVASPLRNRERRVALCPFYLPTGQLPFGLRGDFPTGTELVVGTLELSCLPGDEPRSS